MTDDLLETYNSINIQLKDDPRIIYQQDIFRCCAYTFVTNLRVWVKLANARQSSGIISNNNDFNNPYNRPNITSGWLYNHTVVSGEFNGNANEIEISDLEFEHICQIFIQAAREHPRLSAIIRDIKDPKDAMWDLCYQFIIPIRLLASSIPHNVRLISLRKWINIIFVLPFINKYVNQYSNVIPNCTQLLDNYKQFQADLNNDCEKMKRFANINIKQISSVFISNTACSNNAIRFVRLSMNLFIIGCIDIIKHYCPNFQQCNSINKEFDGTWVNIFDPCHMAHIAKINDLQILVKT